MFCVVLVLHSLSVILCGLCITMCCELCLLYYIFCAILYSVNVAQELFKFSIVCHIIYVAILCVSRIMHFLCCII